ncbi:hypothetical protein A7U60_g1323 [Sanghuangporus baumii]|uniref:Uncharacterized protein n=1 Tax=Sanghuangporus baumii TaxID=108892 RepID=A0A9Q5I4W0_SANBA|nr:hypothetical protein A7U60_g1323 [Sanghuangporus baumii]
MANPENSNVQLTIARGGRPHDLTFTPQQILSRSREAYAVYRQGNYVYKVYRSRETGQHSRALQSYARAEDYGLPVASWNISNCTVRVGNAQTFHGYVEIARMITDGVFFSLQHGDGVFRSALRGVTDKRALQHIVRGCEGAVAVGLRDPQGFIRPNSVGQPIVFIDIHTSNSSEAAQVLLNAARARLEEVNH